MNNRKYWIIGAIIGAAALAFSAFALLEKRQPLPAPRLADKQPSKKCLDEDCYSRVIDLSDWKLTLPLFGADNDAPQEIYQPQLDSFELAPWFTPTPDRKGILFRAPVNAPTTGNTDYPRSELREMDKDGKEEAFWATTDGTHTLLLEEAITAVPLNKPEVVAGQIHGDDDDLLVIRLEYPKLFISRGKSNLLTLDENYVLGKRFTVKFVAEDGKIKVHYNGSAAPVYVLEKKVKMAYFKIGVYTQSNCETEEDPYLCTEGNYGEVAIYRADLDHR